MAYLFKYYAGVYDGFMRRFKLDTNEAILEKLGDVKGKQILDVGGGTGTLADLLEGQGACVTLIDPSEAMAQRARQKNRGITIYIGTLQTVDPIWVKGKFDYVILRDTLHHIRLQEETVALIHGCLKAEGRVIISEFDWQSLKTKGIWLFETLCFERCRMFTMDKLRALCRPYFAEVYMARISGFEMLYIGRKGGEI